MNDTLYLLWTNGDPITAEKMVIMYTHNAKKLDWWEDITVIVWGAPAKLVAESAEIQEKLAKMIADGIHVSACKACADQLGVTADLKSIGIEVKYWGEPLTEILKSGGTLLTI